MIIGLTAGATTILPEANPCGVAAFETGPPKLNGGPSSGSGTSTCNALGAISGNWYSQLVLKFVPDAQGPSALGASVAVTFDTITGFAGFTPSTYTFTLTSTNGNQYDTIVPGSSFSETVDISGSSQLTIPIITVHISSSTPTGTALSSSGKVYLGYSYTSGSGTPEPASFAMIGGGLLALAVAARRRRA